MLFGDEADDLSVGNECDRVEDATSIHDGQAKAGDDAFGFGNQRQQDLFGRAVNAGRVQCVFAVVAADGKFRQTQDRDVLLASLFDGVNDILAVAIPIQRRLVQNTSGDIY